MPVQCLVAAVALLWAPLAGAVQSSRPAGHNASCPAHGQLIFAHVMKTGGIAVDDFFRCRADAEGFSVYRDDGPPEVRKPFGNTECETSVCTTHAPLVDAVNSCGKHFAGARAFTVMRDPVERVWSFYNYVKGNGYKPYQNRSLEHVLKHYWNEDLNKGLPPSERCTFCHHSLFNVMTLWNFVGPETWKVIQECRKGKKLSDADRCVVQHGLLRKAVKEAKERIRNLEAVFFMEDLANFTHLYNGLDGLSLTRTPAAKLQKLDCTIKHANPTKSKEVLSEEAAELIKVLNWADVELYRYAQQIRKKWGFGVKPLKPIVVE
eukprot:TRINITY_DN16510_c0_g1_i1.p1 TRINITY_DN16510_c0_g1~~TRINITY_DN16510_c0_g1_i1.p1  ORF type:complete len:320 (+),score=42.57 TRINITY_DN16510_c0_g1_i1:47-1006(+)